MTEITNTHHFNKNVKLVITDITDNTQKFLWYYKDKLLSPTNSLEDFITQINVVFRFTGVCFDVSYGAGFENCIKGSNPLNIIKQIYQQPLERQIKFVSIGSCGCNMGHCGATTSIEIDQNNCKTYGDVMAVIGYGLEVKGDVYYGYPDSVLLELKQITELPKTIYNGNSCYSDMISVTDVLSPNITYLSWGYYR